MELRSFIEQPYRVIPIPNTINNNYFQNTYSYESDNQLAKDTVKNFVKRESYDISRKKITKELLSQVPKVGKFMTKAGFTVNRFGACMYNQENLLMENGIYSYENILNAYSYCGNKTFENLSFSKLNYQNNQLLKRMYYIGQFLDDTPFEQRYNFSSFNDEMPWYNGNKLLHNTLYFGMDKLNYILSPIETFIVEPVWNNIIDPIWDGVIDMGYKTYDLIESDIIHTKYLIDNFGIVRGLNIRFFEYFIVLPEFVTGNYVDIDVFDENNTKSILDYDYEPQFVKMDFGESIIEQPIQESVKQESVNQKSVNQESIKQESVNQELSMNALDLSIDDLPMMIMPQEKFGEFMSFSSAAIGIMNGLKNWDEMDECQQQKWIIGTALSSATMSESFRKDIGDFGCGAVNILSKLLINGKLRVEEVAGFLVTEITNFFKVSLPFAVGTITNLITAIVTHSNIGKALCDLASEIISINIPVIGQIYGIYKLLTGLLQLFNTCNVNQVKIMGINAVEVDEQHKNLILADDYYYTVVNPFFNIEIKVHSCGGTNHMRRKQEALEEFKRQFKENAYACTGFSWENYVEQNKDKPEKTLYHQYVEFVLREVLYKKWKELNNLTPEEIATLDNYLAKEQKFDVNIFDYLIILWNNWKKFGCKISSYLIPDKIEKTTGNYWDKHEGENLIIFLYNIYILWKTGKEVQSTPVTTMTPEQYQEFIIELNKKRSQANKSQSQQEEKDEKGVAENGTGKYSRMEITKYANKKLFENNISTGTMVAVAGSTISGSMLFSVAYLDKEIETINYIGIKNYFKGKIKGNARMFMESYTSMLVSSHATLTFCLTEYSEKFSKEMLEDFIVPHIGLVSNTLVSNVTNWDIDIEDRIYYFFEGIFRINIGKVISCVKNFFSITTSLGDLIIAKLTEYGIMLSSFFTTYIPVIGSMLFYRFARKLIMGRNDIPPIAMVNTDIQRMVNNQIRLEKFKKIYSFVRNEENGLTDRQIAFEKIQEIENEIKSKNELPNYEISLTDHYPKLQDYSMEFMEY